MNRQTLLTSHVAPVLKSLLFWFIFLLLLLVSGSQLVGFFPDTWRGMTYAILGTVSAVAASFVMTRIERKSLRDYGLTWDKGTWMRFVRGMGWGTAILLSIIGILTLVTDLRIERNFEQWDPYTLYGLIALVPLALMEEIAFRAYPFITLQQAFGIRITQIGVAVIFALYHILQGWDTTVAFLGPGIWAFVFGIAAVKSGGIAMPTGVHFALNFIQTIMGMKDAGTQAMWKLSHAGNDAAGMLWAERAGVATQLIVLAGAVLLTEIHVRKKK